MKFKIIKLLSPAIILIFSNESTLNDKIDFFGRQTTRRGVLYFLTIHLSEHLGQSIAYSRMNGITSPRSIG